MQALPRALITELQSRPQRFLTASRHSSFNTHPVLETVLSVPSGLP
jgi:hypothetical protein